MASSGTTTASPDAPASPMTTGRIPCDMISLITLAALAPDARLLVVGRGPDRALAEALAAELGVGDCLEVVDWVDQAGSKEVRPQPVDGGAGKVLVFP